MEVCLCGSVEVCFWMCGCMAVIHTRLSECMNADV